MGIVASIFLGSETPIHECGLEKKTQFIYNICMPSIQACEWKEVEGGVT
jgi:hypothetical protein